MRPSLDKKKYLITFVITAIIFSAMLYINSILDQKRVVDVKGVQDQISLDLLSSETQFNLLREASCENIGSSTVLSTELNSLAKKLSYLESNDTGKPNPELIYLKKYYSLLEIKDFILMKQINQKCASKPISILYFYGNKSDCADCEKMSYVLTELREEYPELRIYSFDTNLNLSAIDTLKSVYHIDPIALPALVYNENTYAGFKSIDNMKEIIPALKKLDKLKAKSQQATSTATSTKN
jgi:thiol-disulfide isomerase/thioredoxin